VHAQLLIAPPGVEPHVVAVPVPPSEPLRHAFLALEDHVPGFHDDSGNGVDACLVNEHDGRVTAGVEFLLMQHQNGRPVLQITVNAFTPSIMDPMLLLGIGGGIIVVILIVVIAVVVVESKYLHYGEKFTLQMTNGGGVSVSGTTVGLGAAIGAASTFVVQKSQTSKGSGRLQTNAPFVIMTTDGSGNNLISASAAVGSCAVVASKTAGTFVLQSQASDINKDTGKPAVAFPVGDIKFGDTVYIQIGGGGCDNWQYLEYRTDTDGFGPVNTVAGTATFQVTKA
jgi:hypothetical protein